jgi:phospholipid/cholesterol/gamma-HCH transport system substrate-binding protein
MEAKVNFVFVGVFVLVLSTALIAGVLWLSSGKYYRKSYDIYQTYMSESVSGLNLNAPVKYRGVDVGRVRTIALAPENVEQVQLTLDIERGTPLKEDTIAVLQTQGLTGIAYVELTAGHRTSKPLLPQAGERYPVIKSGPSLMGRLESSVTALLTNLNRTSDNVNALMDDDNRRAIRRTLADVEVLSKTLATRSAAIDASLINAERTMRNTAHFTDRLPDLAERLGRSADAFDRMATQVGGAGASASSTIDGTRGDLQRFAGETLPQLHELVTELRDVTATLRRASNEVEQNPSILIYGKPPPRRGPGE